MRRIRLFAALWLLPLTLTSNSTFAQTISFPGKFTSDVQPNSLIQAQDGNFYGTTAAGGLNNSLCGGAGCGTVFKMTPAGSLSTVYSFCSKSNPNNSALSCYDGWSPVGLVQGADGNLYGTTAFGGSSIGKNGAVGPCVDANGNDLGCGTIFEISVSASSVQFTKLHDFYSGTTDDGAFPSPLTVGCVPATAGVCNPGFFGTTLACSGNSCDTSSFFGTLFSFTLGQTTPFSTLYSFTQSDAASFRYPNSVIQGSDGNLYGTTQLGGSGSFCFGSAFQDQGCGGIFEYAFSSRARESDLAQFDNQTGESSNITSSNSVLLSGANPDTIVRQPNRGFPFGGGNASWSFVSYPISLVEGSDGNMYGTTPPACISEPSSSPGTYTAKTNCNGPNDISGIPSAIFQLFLPVSQCTTLTQPLNVIYTFSGNGGNGSGDGGGTTAGLLLASDGNYYGLSGNFVYQLTAADASAFSCTSGIPFLSTLSSLYAQFASGSSTNALVPGSNGSLIQGSDGNFYGTATILKSSTANIGAVFEVTAAPALNGPIQVNISPSQIALNSSATLTWTVSNAFSITAQQCFAFSPSGAGSWTGLQARSGSVSVTPTQPGTYTYSLTCGGTESGLSTELTVIAPLFITTASLPGGTVSSLYPSTQLVAGGGTSPYIWALASGSSLPTGLTLSTGGIISGTPTQSGTVDFSVTVTDSEVPPATKSASLSIDVSAATPTVTANPSTIAISAPGQSGSTTLTFANFSSSTFSVSCVPLPPESGCNLTNIAALSATLQVTTTAPGSAMLGHGMNRGRALFLALTFTGFLGLVAPFNFSRKRSTLIGVLTLLVTFSIAIGCGGNSNPPLPPPSNPGTPKGDYKNIAVTVTAGSQSASAQIEVAVGQ